MGALCCGQPSEKYAAPSEAWVQSRQLIGYTSFERPQAIVRLDRLPEFGGKAGRSLSSHPALQPFLVTAEKGKMGKMFGFCDSKVAELVVYVEELVAALVMKELETKTNLSSALSCGIEGARQLWNKDYPDHIEDKGEVVVNGTFVVVTKTNLSIVLGFVHSVVAIIDKNAEWKQIHPGSSTKKGIDEFVAFEFQGAMKGKNLAAVTVIEHTLVPDDRALVILPRGNLEQLQAMGMPDFNVAAFGHKLDYDGKMIAIALNTQ